MTLQEFLGRFAQFGGLAIAAVFIGMYAGTQTNLVVASGLSRAFVAAGGTNSDMLFGAAIGAFMFAVGTFVFWVTRKV